MTWSREFISQSYNRTIYKHKDFPVYSTDEFDFFRCVEFKKEFYGKTASYLFNGNLRTCTGRYSNLFPNQKLSYWADSPDTARAEIKKHGSGNDILTFWAYDDISSTFPITEYQESLIIIDGRKCGIQELIDKADKNKSLTGAEERYMLSLFKVNPDCLAFDSHAKHGGENFIFFEKGFKKLALRQLRLRFGKKNGGNHNLICCAGTCDYTPYIESYGEYFAPIAKIKMSEDYLQTNEYLERKRVLNNSYKRFKS